MENLVKNSINRLKRILLNKQDIIDDIPYTLLNKQLGFEFYNYLGVCANGGFDKISDYYLSNLVWFDIFGHKVSLTLSDYASLSYCIKKGRNPNTIFPVESFEEYRNKLWSNPDRWEYVEHCIKIFELFLSTKILPELSCSDGNRVVAKGISVV